MLYFSMDELKDVYANLTETHLAELFCSPSKHRFSSLILRVYSLFWEDVPWFPYLLVQNNNCWSERCGTCLMSKYRECFLLCCFHPFLFENLSYNRADNEILTKIIIDPESALWSCYRKIIRSSTGESDLYAFFCDDVGLQGTRYFVFGWLR